MSAAPIPIPTYCDTSLCLKAKWYYDCDTEEVKGYLEQDPFVKAGRLKYTISPWWGSVGTLLP